MLSRSRSRALPICLYIYNNHTLHAIISIFVPCSTLFQARGTREAKGDQFTLKWFALTNETSPTPWGELGLYR